MSGICLVTLPIGNKDDITLKALDSIKAHKIIYAEDTRVFKELCQKLNIDYKDKEIRSFHDHSSEENLKGLLKTATQEGCIFTSDAGSPLISDPAYPIIKAALAQGIDVKTCGGVSSIIVALELSGLAPIPFHFHGFLAREKNRVLDFITTLKSQYGTHIIFEGKSRVMQTLEILTKALANYEFALARELTKEFESVYRFKGEQFSSIKDAIVMKGEFVILIYNPQKESLMTEGNQLLELAQDILKNGAKPKKMAKLLSLITQKPTKEVYEIMSRN
ncbi:MAG: 16S rRNA (cytidine(1402)-2'-O)-methyltransferase [Bacteriovoracaceae bacterium]|nr:16S rRNA (cytidine(1402)-2'-O)-methyltransferase [Bacteriovoracaceae bacterium]